MSNCVFGFPNYADVGVSYTPALSGGSWVAGLPLTNLQDRRLSKVARSVDDAAASTVVRIDLGVARPVGVLALVGHNLSADAIVRWRGGTSSGATDVYDTGSLALSFAAVSAEDRDGINFPVVHIPAAAQTARYWGIDISDQTNVDGYVQIGRLVIAAKYQPTTNMSYGAKLGLEDDTERKVTDGGPAVYNEKPVRRTKRLVLENIDQAEAFANGWRIQRLAGKGKKQLFFVSDAADTTLLHERSFLCVMRELGGLDYPWALHNSMAIELVEEL